MSTGPWRCVVVDDEPLARQTLQLLIARQRDFVLAGECTHGAEAIATIAIEKPDVLFLDVQMPEVNGFEVLRHTDQRTIGLVVFVTAYDQYALEAFEQHAFDYLLKPFTDERFVQVLERVRSRLRERSRATMADKLTALLAQTNARARPTLVIRDGGRTLVIPHEDILWIEAEDYCSRLHLRGSSVLLRQSLRALSEQLPLDRFVRLHRSAIANVDAIRSLEPLTSGDQRLTLCDGSKLKVSRTHRAEVLSALAGRNSISASSFLT